MIHFLETAVHALALLLMCVGLVGATLGILVLVWLTFNAKK